MSFIETIKERARQDRKKIVLPETNDRRTLIAASQIIKEGIADIIMVGKYKKIMEGAMWLDLDLDKVTVVDPEHSEKLDAYTEKLYELRKAKGRTLEISDIRFLG